jgi:hypothetical protein
MLFQRRHAVGRRNYFSRPPWRSYRFLVNTCFLLMVTMIPIYIILHFGLSPNIWAVLSIFTPVIAVIVLWLRVWKAHRDVYQVVSSTSAGERNDNADTDARTMVPLDALAYMLYAGFGLALFAVGTSFLALAEFIGASLNR